MAIGALTEEVAQNLEEAAAATRRFNANGAGYLIGGLLIGLGVGFYVGHRRSQKKLKDVTEQAEKEIESIRDYYQRKAMVTQEKPSIEEIIEEKGYEPEEEDRPTKPPFPVSPPRPRVVPTTPSSIGTEKSKDEGWDFVTELTHRNEEEPYVIHQDEFKNSEKEYSQVIYTYYEVDDVLVDEDNRPLPHADLVVGQDNLKWGHGTDDEDVVFVRNEKLELEMEICRLHSSYEEEVLGLSRDDDDES